MSLYGNNCLITSILLPIRYAGSDGGGARRGSGLVRLASASDSLLPAGTSGISQQASQQRRRSLDRLMAGEGLISSVAPVDQGSSVQGGRRGSLAKVEEDSSSSPEPEEALAPSWVLPRGTPCPPFPRVPYTAITLDSTPHLPTRTQVVVHCYV